MAKAETRVRCRGREFSKKRSSKKKRAESEIEVSCLVFVFDKKSLNEDATFLAWLIWAYMELREISCFNSW